MRFSGGARRVADGHLRHARSIEARQRRNKAVKLAVKIHVFENLGAIGLERSAEIAQLETRGARHQPVRNTGRELTRDGIVHAILAPAAGDVVTLVDFGQQRGNVFRGVL